MVVCPGITEKARSNWLFLPPSRLSHGQTARETRRLVVATGRMDRGNSAARYIWGGDAPSLCGSSDASNSKPAQDATARAARGQGHSASSLRGGDSRSAHPQVFGRGEVGGVASSGCLQTPPVEPDPKTDTAVKISSLGGAGRLASILKAFVPRRLLRYTCAAVA